MRRKLLMLCTCLFFILSGCGTEKSEISKNYDKAVSQYYDGNFYSALDLLKNTQHYKKSEEYRESCEIMGAVQGEYPMETGHTITIDKFDVTGWYINNNDVKTTVTPVSSNTIRFSSDDDSDDSTFTVDITEESVTLTGESGYVFTKKQ